MAGQGSSIVATDYNLIQSTVAGVLSTGSGDTGYGQSLASGQVSANAIISVSQWSNLRDDLLKCRTHQTGADETGSLTTPTTSVKITESDRAAYMNMANTVSTNRLTTPPANQATTENVATPAVLTSNWNGTKTHTITVTFASSEAMRHYFNTGSQFLITADRSGGSPGPGTKDYTWSHMLGTNLTTYPNGMGVIKFNHNSTTCTGSGITSAVGYRQLSTADQTIFQKNATSYLPNKYYVLARLQGANQIIFTIKFEDSSNSGYRADSPNEGNPTYPQFGIDEDVTGTLTSTVQVYRASGSNVSVPLPGGNSSGLL